MEKKWLLEFIKVVTEGKWKKDLGGSVLTADVSEGIYISCDLNPPHHIKERFLNIHVSTKNNYWQVPLSVEPSDMTFAQRDAMRNRQKAKEQVSPPEGRKPDLYVVMGPPASGKTRYIKEHYPRLPVVSPDLYDPNDDLEPGDRWWSKGGPMYHRENIGKAWAWTWERFGELLKSGIDFVFEATLSKAIARSPVINTAKGLGYKVTCVYMCESLQTLLERNAQRIPSVHPDSVARIYLADEEPFLDEGWDQIIMPQDPPNRDLLVFPGPATG